MFFKLSVVNGIEKVGYQERLKKRFFYKIFSDKYDPDVSDFLTLRETGTTVLVLSKSKK